MSLFLSLQHHADAQDTSEHTVLTHVLCVLPYLTFFRCPEHGRAPMCSPMSWTSLSLSLRHCGDIQDTSKHISARSCPYFSLFDTMRTHRTRASTPCSLVSCVSFLISLSLDAQNTGEHISARSCPYFFLRHLADTQDMSEHTGARSCLVCPSLSHFLWTPRTRASINVLAHVLDVSNPVPSTPWGYPGHERAH